MGLLDHIRQSMNEEIKQPIKKQEKITLGNKTPVNLQPETQPIHPKDVKPIGTKAPESAIKKEETIDEAGIIKSIGVAGKETVKAYAKHIAKREEGNLTRAIGFSPAKVASVIGTGVAAYKATRKGEPIKSNRRGSAAKTVIKQAKMKKTAPSADAKKATISADNRVQKTDMQVTATTQKPKKTTQGITAADLIKDEFERKEIFRQFGLKEWINRWDQQPYNPKNMTPQQMFEKGLEHHNKAVAHKDSGDKSAARMHFRTRNHYLANYFHSAPVDDLKKLSLRKMKELISIKESNSIDKILKVCKRLNEG